MQNSAHSFLKFRIIKISYIMQALSTFLKIINIVILNYSSIPINELVYFVSIYY